MKRPARCRPKRRSSRRRHQALRRRENREALGNAGIAGRAISPRICSALQRRRLCRAAGLCRAQQAAPRRTCRRSGALIRDRKRVATCLGFGPRFLHSTGQAYKGGPNTGVFLQITCDDADDLDGPRPDIHLRHRQGGAGARRFRGAGRARPAASCASISARMSHAGLTALEKRHPTGARMSK